MVSILGVGEAPDLDLVLAQPLAMAPSSCACAAWAT